MWTLRETCNLYKDNHAPRRDTQHPRADKQTRIRTRRPVNTSRPVTSESVHAAHIRTYAQGDQYTHDGQSPPNQYTRRTSTAATTPNQYTITRLTPVRRDRTNLPPPAAPPNTHHTHHKRQALQNLLRLIRSILPTIGAVLSQLVGGIPVTNNPPITLRRVSDTRGGVLCSKCHGENDDAFYFCQWCAAPSTYSSKARTAILHCYA